MVNVSRKGGELAQSGKAPIELWTSIDKEECCYRTCKQKNLKNTMCL